MPSPFSLLSDAVGEVRKNPVLPRVALWLFAVPAFVGAQISAFAPAVLESAEGPPWANPLIGALLLLLLASWVMNVWGMAAILLVAKRMLGSRAGRGRTALRATLSEAAAIVPRLFLTTVLRICSAALIFLPWLAVSLFLFLHVSENPIIFCALSAIGIFGMIFYLVRTTFYAVITVAERKGYRSALNQSNVIVRGRTWPVAWRLIIAGFVAFLPNIVILVLQTLAKEGLPTSALLGIDALGAVTQGAGSLIFLLVLTRFYTTLYTPVMRIASLPSKPAKRKPRTKKI